MGNFIAEFKKFAVRGNVIDLAVAVVIGAAFNNIVSSLVNNIITPSMGLLMGGINFSGLAFTVGDAEISYGAFIQAIVDFIIIALVIFIVVKAINRLKDKAEKEPHEKGAIEPPEEIKLLREIRDNLKNHN